MHMIFQPMSNARPMTWAEVRLGLEASHSPPFGQRATWLKYRRVIDLLAMTAATPAEITPASIAGMVAEFQASGARLTTIASNLRVARAVCNYLAAIGVLGVSPFRLARLTIRIPRGYSLKRAYGPAEIARILDQADAEWDRARDIAPTRRANQYRQNEGGGGDVRFRAGRLRALVYLVAYTGVRAREALYIRCRDVDTVRRVVRITGEDRPTKTLASMATIPIPDEAAAILAQWKDEQAARGRSFLISGATQDKPWDQAGARWRPTNQVAALARRAGIQGVTLLALRHSYATNVRRFWSLNSAETQSLLRHTSPETQEHYLHDDVEHLAARVAGISFRSFASTGGGTQGAEG
jgi:integrase